MLWDHALETASAGFQEPSRPPSGPAESVPGEESDEAVAALRPIMLQAAGLRREADEAFKAQIAACAETGAYYVAQTYAYRGDHDLAFESLERAYKQKDSGLIEITGEPLLEGIADDARFESFLRRMKLPDVW